MHDAGLDGPGVSSSRALESREWLIEGIFERDKTETRGKEKGNAVQNIREREHPETPASILLVKYVTRSHRRHACCGCSPLECPPGTGKGLEVAFLLTLKTCSFFLFC